MVGGLALTDCLRRPEVDGVAPIGRRPTGEESGEPWSAKFSVEPRREPEIDYRVMRILYPAVRRFHPNVGIAPDDLARAIVHAGLHGVGRLLSPVLENRGIRSLAGVA